MYFQLTLTFISTLRELALSDTGDRNWSNTREWKLLKIVMCRFSKKKKTANLIFSWQLLLIRLIHAGRSMTLLWWALSYHYMKEGRRGNVVYSSTETEKLKKQHLTTTYHKHGPFLDWFKPLCRSCYSKDDITSFNKRFARHCVCLNFQTLAHF